MTPASTVRALLGQERVERGEQVLVRAGTGLEHRDTGRGVRHEHVQETVTGIDVAEKPFRLVGQVEDARPVAGRDVEKHRLHPADATRR